MKRLTGVPRAAVLALAALACALVSGFVALDAPGWSLPRPDTPWSLPWLETAFGTTALDMLRSPAVLLIWVPLTMGVGLLGYLAALYMLWRVNLLVAVPIVFVATVAGAALLAGVVPLFGGLLVGVTVMQLCQVANAVRGLKRVARDGAA